VIPLNYEGPVGRDLAQRVTLGYSHFSQKFGLEKIFQFYNRIVTATYKHAFDYSGIDAHRLSAGVELNYMQTIFRNDQIIAKIEAEKFWTNGEPRTEVLFS
jgi:hypothetical protein